MEPSIEKLNIGKASKYLGVSIDTLRRWEKKGRITSYRSPGGHRYFNKADLDTLFSKKYTRDYPNLNQPTPIQHTTSQPVAPITFSQPVTVSPETIPQPVTPHKPRFTVEEVVETSIQSEPLDIKHLNVTNSHHFQETSQTPPASLPLESNTGEMEEKLREILSEPQPTPKKSKVDLKIILAIAFAVFLILDAILVVIAIAR